MQTATVAAMRTSNGRTGRVLCFVSSLLLLVVAVVLLTDAVDQDSGPEAARLLALAPVLAMGSMALMIGALVWTLAGRDQAAVPGRQAPEHAGGGYAYGPYQGPPQQGWQPPSGQAPPPAA